MAVTLFGSFLIRKKYKKLEKRIEENGLELRYQILGLSSAKDEIEEARLEFKSYVINQGQFDSMRDDYLPTPARSYSQAERFCGTRRVDFRERKVHAVS